MEIRPDLPEQSDIDPSGQPVEQVPVRLAPIHAPRLGRRLPPFSWWWLASALVAGLVIGFGSLYLLRFLAHPLALMVVAITLANALAPVVDRLSARSIPRTLAVILVHLVLVLILVGVIGLTVPLVVEQVRMLIEQSQTWLPHLSENLSRLGFNASSLLSSFLNQAGSLSGVFLRVPVNIFSGLFEFILIFFLSLYWLALMPRIKRFFLSFYPEERKAGVERTLALMGMGMGGYLRGSAINGLIIGTATYLGLLVIGVPYALTLAALAGVTEFFPFIGPIISGAVMVLVALTIEPRLALITLAFVIILQQTEGHILVPLVMRSQTAISPLLAIFAILAGVALGGFLGAVVAIPIASLLTVLVEAVIAPAIRRANGVPAEENHD